MPPIAGLHSAPQKEWKLQYKIIGRTNEMTKDAEGNVISLDCVHVEWTHADGPVTDKVLLPQNHPPIHPGMDAIEYKEVESGKREVICDQVNVRSGTPDSIVMQALEEKRARLAAALGVEA